MANYNTIDMDDEFMSRNVTERKEKKKKDLALNQGPSTPVKIYEDTDYYGKKVKKVMPNFGAGRIKGRT